MKFKTLSILAITTALISACGEDEPKATVNVVDEGTVSELSTSSGDAYDATPESTSEATSEAISEAKEEIAEIKEEAAENMDETRENIQEGVEEAEEDLENAVEKAEDSMVVEPTTTQETAPTSAQ
jgi:ElaB/YqjD/DUF883 family membrane-anchored ribosome-binding protein